jgi:hypothetical protein
MELIVLNVRMEDLGMLSQTLFAMLVIMAIITTAGTTPACRQALGHLPEPVVARGSD